MTGQNIVVGELNDPPSSRRSFADLCKRFRLGWLVEFVRNDEMTSCYEGKGDVDTLEVMTDGR